MGEFIRREEFVRITEAVKPNDNEVRQVGGYCACEWTIDHTNLQQSVGEIYHVEMF